LDPSFPQLPDGMKLEAVSGVATDLAGNVLVFHRGRSPILVFTSAGKFLRSFGGELFDSTHGLRCDSAGNLWTTDNKNHTVVKLGPAGEVLLTLGERNVKGETERLFDRPADVAAASNGDVFIADGYGNSRVVRLDGSGKFQAAWGKKGQGISEFNLPHAIRIDSKGLVYVGDRENDRVQVFTPEGKFVRKFGGFAPFGLHITADDKLFVADGRANKVLVMTLEGRVLNEWGKLGSEPGNFNLPHGITVDSDGAVYVTEIRGKRVQKFVPQ
jgi:DNA-binding beta-propeller fold protein YncE